MSSPNMPLLLGLRATACTASLCLPQQAFINYNHLVRELAELCVVSSSSFARAPTLLKTKVIDRKHRPHLHVLSIVGDSRCLFYSLLQSQGELVFSSLPLPRPAL